jgi:hypothetical protein
MKVYLNGYKDHWISPITIVDYMFFWTKWSKCSRNKWIIEDKDWVDSPEWADKLADKLTPISNAIKWIGDKIDRPIRYVKIDRYDTWSMDYTLSYIIVPMLKQLRDTKHGHPLVADEDTPEDIRSDKAETPKDGWDSNSDKRWDWVLNEMIWAFEQKLDDDAETIFFDYSVANGKLPWDKDYVGPKYDRDGYMKYQDRMQNGFRLFGKYYQNLWD